MPTGEAEIGRSSSRDPGTVCVFDGLPVLHGFKVGEVVIASVCGYREASFLEQSPAILDGRLHVDLLAASPTHQVIKILGCDVVSVLDSHNSTWSASSSHLSKTLPRAP